jgi:hypothetical protein
MLRPFRAVPVGGLLTQGFALGWYVTPLLGPELSDRNVGNLMVDVASNGFGSRPATMRPWRTFGDSRASARASGPGRLGRGLRGLRTLPSLRRWGSKPFWCTSCFKTARVAAEFLVLALNGGRHGVGYSHDEACCTERLSPRPIALGRGLACVGVGICSAGGGALRAGLGSAPRRAGRRGGPPRLGMAPSHVASLSTGLAQFARGTKGPRCACRVGQGHTGEGGAAVGGGE